MNPKWLLSSTEKFGISISKRVFKFSQIWKEQNEVN